MRASIIIITRDRSESIVETLEALLQQDTKDFEIVVVDSSKGEEQAKTQKVVKQFGARYIAEPRLGQSRARNTGLENITSEIVAFTDDDCVPAKNWLSQKLKNFEDPMVWGCTARVIQHTRDSGSDLFEEVAGQDLGEVKCVFSKNNLRFGPGVLLGNVAKVFSKHMKSHAPVPFGVGHGSSMAFRRETFQKLGKFDERFGSGAPLNGAEDMELFYRVLKSGHSIVYEPTAIVRHKHRVNSAEEVFKTRYGYSHSGAALMWEHRRDSLMFFMFFGRLTQLVIKTTQYKVTRNELLAKSFGSDLRGFLDGWRAHRRLTKGAR